MLFINALSKKFSVAIKKFMSQDSDKTKRIDMEEKVKAYYENLEEVDLRDRPFYPLNDLSDELDSLTNYKEML